MFLNIIEFLKKTSVIKWILFLSYTIVLAGFFFITSDNIFYIQPTEPTQIEGDAGFYDLAALSMSQGQGFGINGLKTSQYQIGYPLVVAGLYKLFGHNYIPIVIIQFLFMLASFYIALFLTSQMFSGRISLIIVALGFITNYKIHSYTYLMYTEILSIFILMVTLLLFFQYRKTKKYIYLVSCGLSFGFLTLTRPVFQLFPWFLLVIMVVYFIWNKKVTIAVINKYLIFVLTYILVISPYIYRNYKEFNLPKLSANGGISFYAATNHEYDGRWIESSKIQQDLNLYPDEDYSYVCIDPNRAKDFDNSFKKAAIKNIINSPLKFIGVYFKNMQRLVAGYSANTDIKLKNIFYTVINHLYLMSIMVGLIISLFKKRFNINLAIYYLLFVYLLLISPLFPSSARYGFPLVIMVYLLLPGVILKINTDKN